MIGWEGDSKGEAPGGRQQKGPRYVCRGYTCGQGAREAYLSNLGGVGVIDEVTHEREPHAARQADVEPFHVHAHKRGVLRLNCRHMLLQGEAALHGGEPAAGKLAPDRDARCGELGSTRHGHLGTARRGQESALERCVEHVKEHAEGVPGGRVAGGKVERAQDGVRDLAVHEAVGDGEELRVEREARRRE